MEINKSNPIVKKKEKSYLYIINNIGLLYQKQNQHKKALSYFQQGLAFDSIQQKYPTQYVLLLENLAASNFLLGNKTNVLQQYNEVLNIRKKLKDYREMSTTFINISDYYKNLGKTKKAKNYAEKALQYAKQTHYNKCTLEALEFFHN